MKTKSVFAIVLIIIAILSQSAFVCFAAEPHCDTVGEAEIFLDGILAHCGVSGKDGIGAYISDTLPENAAQGGEWYALALAQYGRYDFEAYENALVEYLLNNKVASASSRLKFALVLRAVGSDSELITALLDDSIGKQGLMSYVFGLHLLNNACKSEMFSADDVIDAILAMQCSDGGWAVTGNQADVDATAMTLQVLAPHIADEKVRSATDAALAVLSERQLADGDFSSYGTANAESTAQVLIALSALGIDCYSDGRFIKNGCTLFDGLEKYRLESGAFCHAAGGSYSSTATVQVFLSSVAYLRFSAGKSSLYLLDSVFSADEPTPPSSSELASDSSVADSSVSGTADSHEGNSGNTDFTELSESAKLKLWICLAVIALGAAVSILLVILKKRHKNNFIFVAAIVLVAVLFVCFADIKTKDEYYSGDDVSKENAIGTVTISIRCDTVAGRAEHIPADGTILDAFEFQIAEGDTVYTVLTEAARKYGLQLDNSGGAYVYISGIAYLYEFDFGDLSGWVYLVNGETPSVGAGDYRLSDGDVIEWHYTCDLGDDIKR